MRIRIVDKPTFTYPADQKWVDIMVGLAGKWVDVETDFLFDDQYNVAEARVYARHVAEIQDDARIGRMKCYNCGTHSPISKVCPKCRGEWARDKQDLLKPFWPNKSFTWFIIQAVSQNGFWNNQLGWVREAKLASRFTVKDLLNHCLPIVNPDKYADGIDVIPLRGNYNRRYDD